MARPVFTGVCFEATPFRNDDTGKEHAMKLDIPDHWRYELEGLGETDTGDVITRDGEIIGTWELLSGALYTFTPTGASEHLFIDPHLGLLTSRIQEWQEQQERLAD